ncbi:MAG: undecaprenyldiphospho-muramoylpentapeptide beta-N-acetylglucosaminyltransferase [Sporichthyaceae bacterium]|nr:undecaprenyldiphospho-muramoylpentapeptide beta-N-acetylglucosaminyltransferase [Sporichthyaceae bacterium]
MQVVLAGGGTAGHISPALALADALRREDPGIGITALGTARGLEVELIPKHGYNLRLIPAVPLPRRLTADLLRVPGRLRDAVDQAAGILDDVKADVVVGFGGYVALPAYLAARRRQVPIVVHEANARPGLANRIGARFTRFVATSTPDTRLPHARFVGIPLRSAITNLDRGATQAPARAELGLGPAAPTLLVSGGSQGARRLNEAAVAAAPALAAAGVQVLHAHGPANTVTLPPPATGAPTYRAVPYLERMELAYAAADFMLCRAGALTCAELAAVGLPAAYVPLPIGNGEQRLNAEPIVRAGGGLVVDDADLDAAWISGHVIPVLTDPDRLATMGAAAASCGHRDADQVLVRMVRKAAARGAARGSSPASDPAAGSGAGPGLGPGDGQ